MAIFRARGCSLLYKPAYLMQPVLCDIASSPHADNPFQSIGPAAKRVFSSSSATGSPRCSGQTALHTSLRGIPAAAGAAAAEAFSRTRPSKPVGRPRSPARERTRAKRAEQQQQEARPPASMPTAQLHGLTHVDRSGQASMVDVGAKEDTQRVARAEGHVMLGEEAFALVRDNKIKKGDVLQTAKLAGIMGAKRTSSLIPLCHGIMLTRVQVWLTLEPDSSSVRIAGEARTVGKTGVEMEALTAVTVAALTVYDMCKAVSHDIIITGVQLHSKEGGRSGKYERASSTK